MTGTPSETLSPGTRMAVLAGWGFAIAKTLVITHMFGATWGLLFVPAVLTGFGTDVLVVLIVAAIGLGVERAGARGRAATWLLGGMGVVLALWAIANVLLVVEVGRPATFDMLQVGVGGREAWTMLGSVGGRLALLGVALYAITAVPIVRALEPKPPSRKALAALGLYGVAAVVVVGALPRVASTYGLHRNAVAEVALGAVGGIGFAQAETTSVQMARMEFSAPPEAEWTAPVAWDRSARPHNLVLWFAESTGARYTSLFDETAKTTPNLVRLRPHALRFTRYYANCPLSEKALWGILYGMYPFPSVSPMSEINPRIAAPSMMQTLHSRGYRTALFTGALFGVGDKQKLLSERGFDIMIDGETVPNRDQYWHDGWGVDDAAIVEAALDWLDERPDPDQPQFTVMVPIIPHQPYNLPPHVVVPPDDRTEHGRYMAALTYAESLFARFYEGYAARGLADDTLFVYVGDHGEAFGQHPNNRTHPSFIYDENVHVPLMFVHPGLFPTEIVSERMGTHPDLMPTIFELMGETMPAGGDGQSLVGDDFRYRPAFYGAFLRDHLGGLRDGHYKYIHNFDTSYEEVYDLAVDPMETENLVDQVPVEQVSTWRQWIIEHQTHQAALLHDYPSLGPPYLRRIQEGTRVAVEGGDHPEECRVPLLALGKVGCAQAPTVLAVGITRQRIRRVDRECISVHPPPSGSLVIEFPRLEPPPASLGAGLTDEARRLGGAPVEVVWHIGDLDPIAMTVADDGPRAYQVVRLPRIGDGVTGVPARVEVRSDDWSNRDACLILSP